MNLDIELSTTLKSEADRAASIALCADKRFRDWADFGVPPVDPELTALDLPVEADANLNVAGRRRCRKLLDALVPFAINPAGCCVAAGVRVLVNGDSLEELLWQMQARFGEPPLDGQIGSADRPYMAQQVFAAEGADVPLLLALLRCLGDLERLGALRLWEA